MNIAPDILQQLQKDFPADQLPAALAALESASSSPRIQRCIVFAARGHLWYFEYLCRHTKTDYRDVIQAAEYAADIRLYDFNQPLETARINDPFKTDNPAP